MTAHAFHSKMKQPSFRLDWILETQQHCPLKITAQLTFNHLREWIALLGRIGSFDGLDLSSILSPATGIYVRME